MEVNRASRFIFPLMTTHGDIFEEVCLNICFLNSVKSLHGVTPRENPTHHRRYVNIDGHVVEKLFKFIDT